MNRIMRYLTHPQVSIDPHTPVGHWSLSHEGLMRTNKVATATGLSKTTQIISSAETKARQTAMIIAKSLKLEISVRERMHENDRSSTGFLPLAEFEAMADDFFAHPGQSVDGWERAIDAQRRIVGETNQIIAQHDGGDLLLVGHGAVGTLLYCHFADRPISRTFDQPAGGGNYFAVALETGRVLHHWQPMETLLQEQIL